jgi:hypothetical protein
LFSSQDRHHYRRHDQMWYMPHLNQALNLFYLMIDGKRCSNLFFTLEKVIWHGSSHPTPTIISRVLGLICLVYFWPSSLHMTYQSISQIITVYFLPIRFI